MRILIPCLHYFPDSPGGANRLPFDEAKYFAEKGHEVWLVVSDTNAEASAEYRFEHGLHILAYSPPRINSFNHRKLGVHQKMTAELIKRYVPGELSLIHGHSHLQYAGALATLNANKMQKCFTIHSPANLEIRLEARGKPLSTRIRSRISSILNQRIMNRYLALSDVITADSEFTKRTMAGVHSPAMRDRIQVIPGWVDISQFKPAADKSYIKEKLNLDPKLPALFTLRRMVPRMGLERLLYALQAVAQKGLKFNFLVGGAGPMLEQLKLLAMELGLDGNVRFLGHVSEEDLPMLYSASDAFILPSTELECFGIIILEALASGIPVLATPVAAIPEIINRIESKWLSSDTEIGSISKLITDFLEGALPFHSPEVLRDFVKKEYSREKILDKLFNTLLPGHVE